MAGKTKKVYVVVHHDGRYIRKGADAFAEKIMAVKKGDKFEYLNEISNEWYKVRVNKKIGWIHTTTAKIVK